MSRCCRYIKSSANDNLALFRHACFLFSLFYRFFSSFHRFYFLVSSSFPLFYRIFLVLQYYLCSFAFLPLFYRFYCLVLSFFISFLHIFFPYYIVFSLVSSFPPCFIVFFPCFIVFSLFYSIYSLFYRFYFLVWLRKFESQNNAIANYAGGNKFPGLEKQQRSDVLLSERSLKLLLHHSTIALKGLREGALNWFPIMPRDANLSNSRCKFFLSGPKTAPNFCMKCKNFVVSLRHSRHNGGLNEDYLKPLNTKVL